MTDKPKFTPGHWRVKEEGPGRGPELPAFWIVSDYLAPEYPSQVVGSAEERADAHLFVAAPELYAALERVLALLLLDPPHQSATEDQETMALAEAALKKARGEA